MEARKQKTESEKRLTGGSKEDAASVRVRASGAGAVGRQRAAVEAESWDHGHRGARGESPLHCREGDGGVAASGEGGVVEEEAGGAADRGPGLAMREGQAGHRLRQLQHCGVGRRSAFAVVGGTAPLGEGIRFDLMMLKLTVRA